MTSWSSRNVLCTESGAATRTDPPAPPPTLSLIHSSVDGDFPEGLRAKMASHCLASLKLILSSFMSAIINVYEEGLCFWQGCIELDLKRPSQAFSSSVVIAEPTPPPA